MSPGPNQPPGQARHSEPLLSFDWGPLPNARSFIPAIVLAGAACLTLGIASGYLFHVGITPGLPALKHGGYWTLVTVLAGVFLSTGTKYIIHHNNDRAIVSRRGNITTFGPSASLDLDPSPDFMAQAIMLNFLNEALPNPSPLLAQMHLATTMAWLCYMILCKALRNHHIARALLATVCTFVLLLWVVFITYQDRGAPK